MTEKILKNNQAVVAGEIISDFEFSHEVFGEGFYFVKLRVNRLSHSSDTIPLLVSERLIDVTPVSYTHLFKGFYVWKSILA